MPPESSESPITGSTSRRGFLSLGAGVAAVAATSVAVPASAAPASAVPASAAPASAAPASDVPASAAKPLLRFGVIADCQYADADTAIGRYYRLSIPKLTEAVATLNDSDLGFSLHLGDFVDRFPESFDAVLPIWNKLRMAKYMVLGNHDFPMPREQVLTTLSMPSSYYQFGRNGWRFVVVDTNDISLYGNPKGSPNYVLAEQMLAQLTAAGKDNAQTWNGGVGAEQLAWIEQVLNHAQKQGDKVVLNAHHPIYPFSSYNAYNDDQLVDLVTSYDNVVAWFNGHNHDGNYGFTGGKHFLNFKGMVDTPETAYSTVQAFDDHLVVNGFGREPARILPIGAPAYQA